eukprot:gnl/MRDRNA2_/MRDRNA2_156716_c0_seq1.p1 gnl/MRDRNA2_/MRDRNA2_156716_c0~~gnl/MRDRNA2_/MRDRNA2_156716_c0_seq1.p1  ORF type:complete len:201 (-),score=11.73 gnl/MRDRNA2_/MRDRNA2_156716_c0_seq1:93-674(-)
MGSAFCQMYGVHNPFFRQGSLASLFLALCCLLYGPLSAHAQTITTSPDRHPDLGRLLITDEFIADSSESNGQPSANATAIGSDGCKLDEVRSERHHQCVPKPWSDFESCEAEADGSACYDSNEWVNEHCCESCPGGCGDSLELDLFGRLMIPLGPIIVICCCCGFLCYRNAKSQGTQQQSSQSVQPAMVGRSG